MDLDQFASAVHQSAPGWLALGIQSELIPTNPDHLSRSNWAAELRLESRIAIGNLTVWKSGEAELAVTYRQDLSEVLRHYDLSDESLLSCLDQLIALMAHQQGGGQQPSG